MKDIDQRKSHIGQHVCVCVSYILYLKILLEFIEFQKAKKKSICLLRIERKYITLYVCYLILGDTSLFCMYNRKLIYNTGTYFERLLTTH